MAIAVREELRVSDAPKTSAPPEASRFGRAYAAAYALLCGTHPHVRPWHFQWLSGTYLYASLAELLSDFSGKILDAGCGDQPYRSCFGNITEYVGLDIYDGPRVDIVVSPTEAWPLPTGYYDVVFSSQALEHVQDLQLMMSEMDRVLRKGGSMILSFPFIYNEHGSPNDFRRFTAYGAAVLFPEMEVVRLERQGGLGSTVGILVLNWMDISLNRTKAGRFIRAPILPVWILFSFAMNLFAVTIDLLDRTGAFYSNLIVVLRKKAS
jgi:SAM-dependent methyltransferase